MNGSSVDLPKKRGVDGGGSGGMLLSTAGREQEDGISQQLMFMMNQLMDHSRTQMASMQTELRNMRQDMKDMKEEMKAMSEKCDKMGELLRESQIYQESGFDFVLRRQRYHEILLKNQKWEYPVPVSNRPGDTFARHLKRKTCDMKYGRCRGDISIVALGDEARAQGDRLSRHWKEFIAALEEHQFALDCLHGNEQSSLSLFGNFGLHASIIYNLSNALKSTYFKSLSLDGNIGDNSIQMALDYMQNNPVLESFTLCRNTFPSNDDIDRMCHIVKGHSSISHITLVECFGDGIDDHDTLCSLMTAGVDKLTSIYFCGNSVTTQGNMFVSDFLEANPTLKNLDLSGNNLDDQDAASIARSLKHNSNLRYLDLEDNPITKIGWKDLQNAEFDSSGLNAAARSNHTCCIESKSIFNLYSDKSISKAVRQKKIYYLLSGRNKMCTNVQHFDDVPIELLPDMLISIQKYAEYHTGKDGEDDDELPDQDGNDSNAISIVYEVLRRWDKALSVYENLSIA